jgi:hypothetical protein
MNIGSATLALECRNHGEAWHTLNVATYATTAGEKQERARLLEFQAAWARCDAFSGHEFRIVERAQ